MTEALVLVEQTGTVRCLTLCRPQALNSFTAELHQALLAALAAAATDTGVRCVLLTGAGRGFCAGQDLAEITPAAGGPPTDLGAVVAGRYLPLMLRIRTMPVPVIAAVNGVAAGAGANLALGCDLVIAAKSASFIQAFSKIGLLPDSGGTWLLPRLVGRAQALGLTLLGDKLPAQQAKDIGLIWQCADDADLMPQAMALAQRLAAMPSKALVATRMALDAAQQMDLAGALQMEAQQQQALGFAHDYQEGVQAFFDKRAPQFTDR